MHNSEAIYILYYQSGHKLLKKYGQFFNVAYF